jgi:centromere/kinetochore protein ZW10
LGDHAKLAQESVDAEVKYEAISHLQQCRVKLIYLESLILAGKLSDAVQAHVDMDLWFEQAPMSLSQTNVILDAKVRQVFAGMFLTYALSKAEVPSCEGPD